MYAQEHSLLHEVVDKILADRSCELLADAAQLVLRSGGRWRGVILRMERAAVVSTKRRENLWHQQRRVFGPALDERKNLPVDLCLQGRLFGTQTGDTR